MPSRAGGSTWAREGVPLGSSALFSLVAWVPLRGLAWDLTVGQSVWWVGTFVASASIRFLIRFPRSAIRPSFLSGAP